MDKNSATGLFLISALLLIYLFFFSPKKEDVKAPGKTPPPTAASAPATAPAVAPALAPEAALDTAATAAVAQDVAISNENLNVTFSTRGGRVAAVRLKKYKTFFGQPLDLFDAKSARM